jgi:hypothetical protein
MKLNRIVVTIAVLAIVSVAVVGQEISGETFMLQLATELSELGWNEDAVQQFKNAANGLDWSGAENADPKLVAWALEFGMSDDAVAVQERAQLALALATHTAQMTRLGYTDRDLAAAAVQATRLATETMTRSRNESGDPDAIGDMVRTRLGEAMEQQTRTATQVRNGNQTGNIYRIGESDPGVPVSPDEQPNPGNPDGPADSGTSDGTGESAGPRN